MLKKLLNYELLAAILLAFIIILWEYYILSLAITSIIIYTIAASYVIYIFTYKEGSTPAPHGLIVTVLFGIPVALILVVFIYFFHGAFWFSIAETLLSFLYIPFILTYDYRK